jgi:2-polyprenyl-3-methyl-5-hydroxy-6-metoxy-1,4-benzoquinol methylase
MPQNSSAVSAENLWGYKKRLRFFIKEMRRHAGKLGRPVRILDVGCGNGSFVALPLAEEGFEVVGVDSDAKSIEKANLLNPFDHVRFHPLRSPSDLETLGKFDVVICSEVLEHLENPAAMLKNINAVTADDALIIVTTPNGYGPFEVENYVLRKTRLMEFLVFCKRMLLGPSAPAAVPMPGMGTATENNESPHIQFFRYGRLVKIFASTGLEVSKLKKSTFLGGSLSNKLLQRWQGALILNARLADFLPYFMVSGWYFVLRKRNGIGTVSEHAQRKL